MVLRKDWIRFDAIAGMEVVHVPRRCQLRIDLALNRDLVRVRTLQAAGRYPRVLDNLLFINQLAIRCAEGD